MGILFHAVGAGALPPEEEKCPRVSRLAEAVQLSGAGPAVRLHLCGHARKTRATEVNSIGTQACEASLGMGARPGLRAGNPASPRTYDDLNCV